LGQVFEKLGQSGQFKVARMLFVVKEDEGSALVDEAFEQSGRLRLRESGREGIHEGVSTRCGR
jgi:hypothetical protein